jgi:hypothetical protein
LAGGPTIQDMLANAAFMLGVTVGLRDGIEPMIHGLPFTLAETSFYRAARDGMAATLLWPTARGVSPIERTARELAASLLAVADRGLDLLGVDSAERSPLLGVIADRVTNGRSGARWQSTALRRLRRTLSRTDALTTLVSEYATRSDTNEPVHRWPTV